MPCHPQAFNFNPVLMGPRVDGDVLPAQPEVLMVEGRYKITNVISGITSHEGGLFAMREYLLLNPFKDGNISYRYGMPLNCATFDSSAKVRNFPSPISQFYLYQLLKK